jgi:NADH-quinone oxidoreductase subunit H
LLFLFYLVFLAFQIQLIKIPIFFIFLPVPDNEWDIWKWQRIIEFWAAAYIRAPFSVLFLEILEFILLALVVIIPLLISIAYYTLAERKIMAAIQRRKGPNVVGFWGLLQPLADGLKLVLKEMIIPRRSNILLFIFAPMLTLILSFLLWAVIPFNFGNCFIDLHLGVLYILAISGLAVYGVVIAGWASNSKYSFLGALRASAQMISYEVSISLAIVQIVLVTGSLNLTDIVLIQKDNVYNIFLLFPTSFIFFISILAETNRAPFDLAEAEAEIVAGIYLEYSAIIFAMFFLGEYCNMIAMSALMNTFFFGGWCLPYFELFFVGEIIFAIKTVGIAFLFIVVRAMLPRYRYDQLMIIGWKVFLPVNLGFLICSASILFGFDILPNYASL